MTAKGRRRRRNILQRRQRRFAVHVAWQRVLVQVVGAFVASLLFCGTGVRFVSEGRPVLGTILVLGSGLTFYVFGYLWTHEIDNVVLRVEPAGIRYYERFVAWSEISDVQLVRRRRTPDRLVVTLHRGQSFTILDDCLSLPMDELLYRIKRRI